MGERGRGKVVVPLQLADAGTGARLVDAVEELAGGGFVHLGEGGGGEQNKNEQKRASLHINLDARRSGT